MILTHEDSWHYHLDEGVKLTATQVSDSALSWLREALKARLIEGHIPLFKAIDTNGKHSGGVQGLYIEAIAPEVTEEENKHAFNTIDTDN